MMTSKMFARTVSGAVGSVDGGERDFFYPALTMHWRLTGEFVYFYLLWGPKYMP